MGGSGAGMALGLSVADLERFIVAAVSKAVGAALATLAPLALGPTPLRGSQFHALPVEPLDNMPTAPASVCLVVTNAQLDPNKVIEPPHIIHILKLGWHKHIPLHHLTNAQCKAVHDSR